MFGIQVRSGVSDPAQSKRRELSRRGGDERYSEE